MVKIMIVDDMVVIQEVLKELLSLRGHQVVFTASNGQQVVDYFINPNNDCPDVIIMDQRMPEKDGLTASKEILAIDSSVKIIFVSADDSIRKEAIDNGISGFLVKPIEIQSVLGMIDELTV